MNVPAVPHADGLHRRAFSADDLRRMTEAGILGEEESVELLDGELIEMSPKGHRHDWVRDKLTRALFSALGDEMMVSAEGTLQLDAMTLVEPDILVFREHDAFPSADGYKIVPGPKVLLPIEIADTSLAYDRRQKASLYAAHGVPEYWIIDLRTPQTLVHRRPGGGGYQEMREAPAEQRLTASAAELAGFAMTLSDLL